MRFKDRAIKLKNTFSYNPLFSRVYYYWKNTKRQKEQSLLNQIINDADCVYLDCEIPNSHHVGVVRNSKSYWSPISDNVPKYERFLVNNKISYSILDLDISNWQEIVTKYSSVIWPVDSEPAFLERIKDKIFFIQHYLGIPCYPSYEQVWSYENKINQNYVLQHLGLPTVKTFISMNLHETLKHIESAEFPLISKIATCSGSRGVEFIPTYKVALKLARRVFSNGRPTPYNYLRQKNYVYFQEYIADALYDLRVIIVGGKIFGYYRMKPKNDFRASGAGLYEKRELPLAAVKIAMHLKSKLNLGIVATDFVYDQRTEQFLIIEFSIFFGVETPEQLKVNDVAGYYNYCEEKDTLIFNEGRYWVQELLLKEFYERLNF